MRVGFIGAGKVGTAYGSYLKSHGISVEGYYSKTMDSAAKAAVQTGSKAYSNIENLVADTDLIFITTNDDQIEAVCNSVSKCEALDSRHIVAHMSGALPSDILGSAAEKGCCTYSVHPLISIADSGFDGMFDNAVFFIEGNNKSLSTITGLVSRTNNKYHIISPEKKALYHASACIASNYLVTVADTALSCLEDIGINHSDGIEALMPLIKSTIENIGRLGTASALTGPIARGDAKTVSRHIEAFGSNKSNIARLYSFLGIHTLELAKQKKLKDTEKITALEKLLRGGE
ncbi:MAG: Rossmann-like and DUF2520 domain-containing protein [Bacillota bacterium]